MADLTAKLSGLKIIKMPDYWETTYEVKAAEAAIFDGALVDIDTTAGTAVHADDAASGRLFVGMAINNDIENGATAGNRVTVARGLVAFGHSIDTGSLAAADVGRPMYVGDDDQEISDYSNIEAPRYVGRVRPDAAGTAFGVHIPADFQRDKEGLELFTQTTAVTGAAQDVTITGAGEIVHCSAIIEQGTAFTTGCTVQAKPSATAGKVTITVSKEDGTSGVNEAATVAVNILITAWGFKRAKMA